MRVRFVAQVVAPLLTLGLVLAACGDDDDDASTGATATTGASATTESTATTEAGGEENEELCALAEEMFEQDDIPSAAQIEKYTELAPEETEDAVAIAGPPIIEADGDFAAFLVALADDDVEDAMFEINDWERENCGIEHEPSYPAEANEVDPEATRVDVTASEYTFEFDKEVPAGRTSFVMTNAGKEVHFLALTRINEGHTLEEALSFEGDAEEAGLVTDAEYDSGLAAPGGDDEEVVTVELESGNWVALCFIPGPDGTPHAFSGMAVPFTVS
jgi:hypothetical protein